MYVALVGRVRSCAFGAAVHFSAFPHKANVADRNGTVVVITVKLQRLCWKT